MEMRKGVLKLVFDPGFVAAKNKAAAQRAANVKASTASVPAKPHQSFKNQVLAVFASCCVCQGQQEGQPEVVLSSEQWTYGDWIMALLLVILLALASVGANVLYLMQTRGFRLKQPIWRRVLETVRLRTVGTQNPGTYRRDMTNPHFQVGNQGFWADGLVWIDEETLLDRCKVPRQFVLADAPL